MTSSVIRIVSGIFLSVSVLSPVLKISFDPVTDYFDSIQTEAASISDVGIMDANSEMETIIKDRLAAYIVNKANTFGLSIQAEVGLDSQMLPVNVILTGKASPYNRQRLVAYITDTLGISKEEVVWK